MRPETSDLSSQTSYMNILESALDADEPPQSSKAPKIPYKPEGARRSSLICLVTQS